MCELCNDTGLIETPLRRSGIGEMIIEEGGEQFDCPCTEQEPIVGHPEGKPADMDWSDWYALNNVD